MKDAHVLRPSRRRDGLRQFNFAATGFRTAVDALLTLYSLGAFKSGTQGMAQRLNSPAGIVLDPNAIESMMVAYELVSRSLHDDTSRRPDVVKQVIAKHILQRANAGEREPVALAKDVLRVFGLDDSGLVARDLR
jgi:hypothetical protein